MWRCYKKEPVKDSKDSKESKTVLSNATHHKFKSASRLGFPTKQSTKAYQVAVLSKRIRVWGRKWTTDDVFIVIVGSKGKKWFHRPLHKSSNMPQLHCLPLLGICCSSFGAGVPAEAEWSWIWHVFDGGVTSSSCCHSFRFIFWLCQLTLLLYTQYGPLESMLCHSSAFFFHSWTLIHVPSISHLQPFAKRLAVAAFGNLKTNKTK